LQGFGLIVRSGAPAVRGASLNCAGSRLLVLTTALARSAPRCSAGTAARERVPASGLTKRFTWTVLWLTALNACAGVGCSLYSLPSVSTKRRSGRWLVVRLRGLRSGDLMGDSLAGESSLGGAVLRRCAGGLIGDSGLVPLAGFAARREDVRLLPPAIVANAITKQSKNVQAILQPLVRGATSKL
jgi:hypothetical protein